MRVEAGELKKFRKNRLLGRFSHQAAGRTIPSYCSTQIQTTALPSDLLLSYQPGIGGGWSSVPKESACRFQGALRAGHRTRRSNSGADLGSRWSLGVAEAIVSPSGGPSNVRTQPTVVGFRPLSAKDHWVSPVIGSLGHMPHSDLAVRPTQWRFGARPNRAMEGRVDCPR